MDMRSQIDVLTSDLRFAFRSLSRAKGLAITVILTLALGIGANAAIFTIVRGVLLRPLVNRDESTLIYVRQSQPGLGNPNASFSVPELQDIESGVHSINQFGEFSTIAFSVVGLGAPREVRAGVVGGSYFNVMGLHPALGRLIGPRNDGPNAAGVVVLTYRFWSTTLHSDPSFIGKTVRLGSGSQGSRVATIIGVLEPSIPYPTETELIANIVTSPHHLSATMVTGRVHRMTELFGRLAPGATLDQARTELQAVYARMTSDHREAYPKEAMSAISAVRLREQITSQARPILLILLAASGLIYIIACSNVANLILARSIRRESELAVRGALGASVGALRRTLLVESVLLASAGALLGLLTANPMVAILARYASRFTVRAVDLTVDSSMLWVGAGLAIVAAVLLAFIPRLPSSRSSQTIAISSGGVRITGGTNAGSACSPSRRSPLRSCCSQAPVHSLRPCSTCNARTRRSTRSMCSPSTSLSTPTARLKRRSWTSIRKRSAAWRCSPASRRSPWETSFPGATTTSSSGCSSLPKGTFRPRARTTRARSIARSRPDISPRSAFRLSKDATSMIWIGTPLTPW